MLHSNLKTDSMKKGGRLFSKAVLYEGYFTTLTYFFIFDIDSRVVNASATNLRLGLNA